MSNDTLSVLGGLRLEDGRRWADAAYEFQLDDARAFLSGTPRRHYWLRSRGASKSTDAGALLLALLATVAPARSRSYLVAVDSDQAGLIHDGMAGIVARTPGLPVKVEAKRVLATNGASVEVLASDSASAWGLRPWVLAIDEVAAWPETGNHRRLMSALMSALPKVKDSRALVLTTPGDPSHPSYKLWERAVKDPKTWYTSQVPGPTPWWSEADVEAARADLMPAEFARLVLCQWAASDDKLTSLDDVRACVTHEGVLEPQKGRTYVLALDIGVKKDATALAVAHLEPDSRIVVDRIVRWTGSRIHPVDLLEVQAAVIELSNAYGKAALVFDPSQAYLLAQGIRKAGISATEFTFTAANIDRLARALYVALRDRTVGLPNDEALVTELAQVKLVERGVGQYRIDHTSGKHDDQAVAVAMAVHHFADAGAAASERARKKALSMELPDFNAGLRKLSLEKQAHVDMNGTMAGWREAPRPW
jgi:phage terminase large subunit-like protein